MPTLRCFRPLQLLPLLAGPVGLAAQEPAAGPPYVSMGQPPVWKPYAGVAVGLNDLSGNTAVGGLGYLGVTKSLVNPMTGGPSLVAEGYLGAAGEPVSGVDGGLRAALGLPILFTQFGVDWNPRVDKAQFFMSAILPLRRGGLFVRGGQFRVDWIPARNQTLQMGMTMPLGQRWVGKTRPRRLEVDLPKPPRRAEAVPLDATAQEILAGVRSYALRVARWGFPISWAEGGSYQETVARAETLYTAFRDSLRTGDALSPGGHSSRGDHDVYLRETDRLFGHAAGDAARGAVIGDSARAAMLDEVFLPYNRLMAQYKEPDGLHGLGTAARRRFAAWVDGPAGLAPDRRVAVLAAYDAWAAALDDVRAWILRRGRGDTRGTWLPMHLVLRDEQHDTQAEIDGIIAKTLGRGFSGGNAAVYISGQQFQQELHHQIMATRDYHVLWIHDYRGRTPDGRTDLIGFYQSVPTYLAALTRAVRAYDRTGKIPAYLLIFDQHYYEANGGKLWMSLLEHPLSARVQLPVPKGKAAAAPSAARQLVVAERLAAAIAEAQDSLRAAVAASTRLQAEARERGADWIGQVVKVHVSITQPSDMTFRTARLLGLPFAPDNFIRDHRKIAFHDVTELDPVAGSAMYAGVGVGEHYVSATWEDRALLVQGPALVALKTAARELLLANGFRPDEVPAPLRAQPFPADYGARVAALERAGATARIMQVHNDVGFADKEATVVQMLLYDLMPAGSVIYVPDSIWTSFLWTGQLVAAAFRGCHVHIVAPARENAPSAAAPTLSRTQELYAQTVQAQRILREEIERAGGRLRVGLYTRQSAVTDLPGLLREAAVGVRQYPFLRDEFPLGDSFFADLGAVSDSLTQAGFKPAEMLLEEEARAPKLHRKTQFFASRAMLEALARNPAVPARYREDMRTAFRNRIVTGTADTLARDERTLAERAILAAHDGLAPALRDSAVLYLSVGSLNKDWRGAALDGESLALVAGKWALIGWIDFFYLTTRTTWLDDLTQFEALLPPYSNFERWLGRRMRNIL